MLESTPLRTGFVGEPIPAGIPNIDQYMRSYCDRVGLSSIPNWDFYMAYVFFRYAAIAQGVYKRSTSGSLLILLL